MWGWGCWGSDSHSPTVKDEERGGRSSVVTGGAIGQSVRGQTYTEPLSHGAGGRHGACAGDGGGGRQGRVERFTMSR